MPAEPLTAHLVESHLQLFHALEELLTADPTNRVQRTNTAKKAYLYSSRLLRPEGPWKWLQGTAKAGMLVESREGTQRRLIEIQQREGESSCIDPPMTTSWTDHLSRDGDWVQYEAVHPRRGVDVNYLHWQKMGSWEKWAKGGQVIEEKS